MGKNLRPVFVGASILIGCALLASCTDKEISNPDTSVVSSAIIVNDNFYSITEKTIFVGKSVEWSWEGKIGHSVTAGTSTNPDGSYDSGIISTGTFSRMFDTEGTYYYHCKVHGASMTGTITVMATSGSGDSGDY